VPTIGKPTNAGSGLQAAKATIFPQIWCFPWLLAKKTLGGAHAAVPLWQLLWFSQS
jgi:hypothetical protein